MRIPSCVVNGTSSLSGRSTIITTPMRQVPTFLTIPSITFPVSTICLAIGLFSYSFEFGTFFLMASSREIFRSSGTIFANLSASTHRASPLLCSYIPHHHLAPKVLKGWIILATQSRPYFARTYSIHLSSSRIQKSISKSGGDTPRGFKTFQKVAQNEEGQYQ